MWFDKPKDDDGLFRGVLLAYGIVVLHGVLIAGLLLMVIFFHGLLSYFSFIFLGGAAGIGFWLYRAIRRAKAQGKSLKQMLDLPALRGRSVEVQFLGGLASVKLGKGIDNHLLDSQTARSSRLLEDPVSQQIRELTALASLLEKDLITIEEYTAAKKQLLSGSVPGSRFTVHG
jgi:hypothetical protein